MKSNNVVLNGESLSLNQAQHIAEGAEVLISSEVKEKIQASNNFIEKLSKEAKPIYGVTTGFGYLANQKISKNQRQELQHNIITSHASGYGNNFSIPETRLAMALRLNVLLRGFSGVRFQLCEALCKLLNANIYPNIPEYGSVGASGDLAPLAHLALPLIGEGYVRYKDKEMTAAAALKKAGLKPYVLQKKEGLALINGTQVMLACGGLAFLQAGKLLEQADKIAATKL